MKKLKASYESARLAIIMALNAYQSYDHHDSDVSPAFEAKLPPDSAVLRKRKHVTTACDKCMYGKTKVRCCQGQYLISAMCANPVPDALQKHFHMFMTLKKITEYDRMRNRGSNNWSMRSKSCVASSRTRASISAAHWKNLNSHTSQIKSYVANQERCSKACLV